MNSASDVLSGPPSPARRPGIPGSFVAIGMLLAGLLATLAIFVYWELHTGPFRPLTEAIGRTLPHSLPKVEGGRHKDGPMILRIAIRVPFRPDAEDQVTQQTVNQVIQLAQQKAELKQFQELHLHLFQLAPERLAKQASFEYPISEIADRVPFPAVMEMPIEK